jgi:hypothetical protein
MQDDAEKQEQDKNRSAGGPEGEPRDQQYKRDVNSQLNAGDANDRN